jgi:hypothetical protein
MPKWSIRRCKQRLAAASRCEHAALGWRILSVQHKIDSDDRPDAPEWEAVDGYGVID